MSMRLGDRNKLVSAMVFVLIDGANDLLFLDERACDAHSKRGGELSKQVVEKKKEEATQRKG